MIAKTANRNMDRWDGQTCTCATGHYLRCPCPNLARVKVTWGCVHEHLHCAYLCTGCAMTVKSTGGIACHRCRDSARPHLCTMTEMKQEPYDHQERAS